MATSLSPGRRRRPHRLRRHQVGRGPQSSIGPAVAFAAIGWAARRCPRGRGRHRSRRHRRWRRQDAGARMMPLRRAAWFLDQHHRPFPAGSRMTSRTVPDPDRRHGRAIFWPDQLLRIRLVRLVEVSASGSQCWPVVRSSPPSQPRWACLRPPRRPPRSSRERVPVALSAPAPRAFSASSTMARRRSRLPAAAPSGTAGRRTASCDALPSPANSMAHLQVTPGNHRLNGRGCGCGRQLAATSLDR